MYYIRFMLYHKQIEHMLFWLKNERPNSFVLTFQIKYCFRKMDLLGLVYISIIIAYTVSIHKINQSIFYSAYWILKYKIYKRHISNKSKRGKFVYVIYVSYVNITITLFFFLPSCFSAISHNLFFSNQNTFKQNLLSKLTLCSLLGCPTRCASQLNCSEQCLHKYQGGHCSIVDRSGINCTHGYKEDTCNYKF